MCGNKTKLKEPLKETKRTTKFKEESFNMTSAVTLEHLCKPLNVDLSECEQLNSYIEDLNSEIEDLNSYIEDLIAEQEGLKDDIEDLNSEIKDVKDELKDVLTRFKDLVDYIVEPDTSFDDVKSSAEKLLKYSMFWNLE